MLRHRTPHVVQASKLRLGLNQREEHTKLCTVELLEDAVEDIVVVEEVLATIDTTDCKWLLQLQKHVVELTHELCTRHRRRYSRESKDNLQPLLNVDLHVQRSQYRSDTVFVDNTVCAVTEPRSNSQHFAMRDFRFK